MGLLHGRAGRLTAKNGGFRPLVPPPVWSTIYLLPQKLTSPRFTILKRFRPRGGQKQVSSATCTLGTSFGCNDNKVGAANEPTLFFAADLVANEVACSGSVARFLLALVANEVACSILK